MITTPYTKATLSISAFDVDSPSAQLGFLGEVDEIFGWVTSTNTWV